MRLRYSIKKAQSPIIAVAIHDGHAIDDALSPYIALQEHERFREEDPYTGYLADLPVNQIVVASSRFQTDLNRRREKAVYRLPEDAWGLQVWRSELPETLVTQLLADYDGFYRGVAQLLGDTIRQFGKFVVLDIHSYNHRRDAAGQEANAVDNPEINIGTVHNHGKWKAMGQRLISYLSYHQVMGRHPDIRENVKFGGGGFSEWINQRHGEHGCVFSLEFKKTFMDEWTGRVDLRHLNELKQMLQGCLPYLEYALDGNK